MSILYKNKNGYFISHEKFINNIYNNIDNGNICFNSNVFHIYKPYKIKKTKQIIDVEANYIQEIYSKFKIELLKCKILPYEDSSEDNAAAISIANGIYCKSQENLVKNAIGGNIGSAIKKTLNGTNYLFPENCEFYSKDVIDIGEYLQGKKYDLIILDPPWWNRYIRRKRKQSSNASYAMMFNDDLKKIPIETLLKNDGVVVVWCTNSQSHLNQLKTDIFPKWKLNYVCIWFWLKITKTGEPVYCFNKPLGKQPYEKIIIACGKERKLDLMENQLVVSVPSAIHSHKPPLIELLKPFLPSKSNCLEIFARYLLPNFTSYGNEVLRLQHECLYENKTNL